MDRAQCDDRVSPPKDVGLAQLVKENGHSVLDSWVALIRTGNSAPAAHQFHRPASPNSFLLHPAELLGFNAVREDTPFGQPADASALPVVNELIGDQDVNVSIFACQALVLSPQLVARWKTIALEQLHSLFDE